MIDKILNHKSKGVTGTVYNKYEYWKEKKDAMKKWNKRLKEIIATGNNQSATGSKIPS